MCRAALVSHTVTCTQLSVAERKKKTDEKLSQIITFIGLNFMVRRTYFVARSTMQIACESHVLAPQGCRGSIVGMTLQHTPTHTRSAGTKN